MSCGRRFRRIFMAKQFAFAINFAAKTTNTDTHKHTTAGLLFSNQQTRAQGKRIEDSTARPLAAMCGQILVFKGDATDWATSCNFVPERFERCAGLCKTVPSQPSYSLACWPRAAGKDSSQVRVPFLSSFQGVSSPPPTFPFFAAFFKEVRAAFRKSSLLREG